jgi:hypothetical protein
MMLDLSRIVGLMPAHVRINSAKLTWHRISGMKAILLQIGRTKAAHQTQIGVT